MFRGAVSERLDEQILSGVLKKVVASVYNKSYIKRRHNLSGEKISTNDSTTIDGRVEESIISFG